MTSTTFKATPAITTTFIAEKDRLNLLSDFFGYQLMIRGESLVYAHMGRLALAYNGGSWDFYTLSNGGFYMAPKAESFEVTNELTTVTLSGDAAGVAATMLAIDQLLSSGAGCDKLRSSYQALRDYASSHAQASLIGKLTNQTSAQ